MTLFERIAFLVRSNLNELLDRTKDPERKVNEIILEMEKNLRELKSQVALSVTDQHLLARKLDDYRAENVGWMQKAEDYLKSGDEEAACAALGRSVSFQCLVEKVEKQLAEQKEGVAGLKSLFARLQQKLDEVRTKGEIIAVQGRRSRALDQAVDVKAVAEDRLEKSALDRLAKEIELAALVSHARVQISEEGFEEKLMEIERNLEVDSMLAKLKKQVKPHGKD